MKREKKVSKAKIPMLLCASACGGADDDDCDGYLLRMGQYEKLKKDTNIENIHQNAMIRRKRKHYRSDSCTQGFLRLIFQLSDFLVVGSFLY